MPNRWCLIALFAAGCGDEAPGPSSEDFALAADGLDSIDSEAAVVDAIELSLSGDFAFTPMNADEPPDVTLDRTIKAATTFAANRLAPMTCISSSGPANQVVTHELANCSVNGRTVTGTVTSTWRLEDTVHVDHEARDLQIDGRAVDLIVSVSGYPNGMIQTRRRIVTLAVVDDSGATIVVTGEWIATLDMAAGCGTKDGAGSTALDGVALVRHDLELAWCGDGIADTVISGEVQLVRGVTAVNLVFLGDEQVVLDGNNYTLDSTVSELRD